jgi:hypothetical protein
MNRLCTLLLLLLPTSLLAADFDPTSLEWNGLNKLQETAGHADAQIHTQRTLDWAQVDEHDVLLVIAPQIAPHGAALDSLTRFVESGGRLIVADDFAQGAAWLAPFGLTLVPEPARALQHYEGVSGLPMVTIAPDAESERIAQRWQMHGAKLSLAAFLNHELHAPVVLNHPATLRIAEEDRPIVAWGRFDEPDAAWLAETEFGAGRVLALADPSVWLNTMLERFHDNKQFAANVLRYYCVAERPCRVTLLANATAVSGIFTLHHAQPRAGLRAGLEQLADVLRHLGHLLQGRLVGPALVLLVLLFLGLPILLRARTGPPIVPPEPTALRERTALMDTVLAWLGNLNADYRKPARLLAAHLQRRLRQLQRDPLSREHGDPVAAMIRQGRVHPNAGPRLQSVLDGVNDAAETDDVPLSRARFGQLAADVEWAESLLAHTDVQQREEVEDWRSPPTSGIVRPA